MEEHEEPIGYSYQIDTPTHLGKVSVLIELSERGKVVSGDNENNELISDEQQAQASEEDKSVDPLENVYAERAKALMQGGIDAVTSPYPELYLWERQKFSKSGLKGQRLVSS